MTKTINIAGLGIVNLRKRKNAVRLCFTIKKTGELGLSIPVSCPESYAVKWLNDNKESLSLKLNRIRSALPQKKPFQTGTNRLSYRSDFCIVKSPIKKVTGYIRSGNYIIHIPDPADPAIHSDEISSIVKEFLRLELNEILEAKLKFFAEKFKFSYKSYRVSSARTRWGSCSGRNTLSFSCYLARLPEEIIDYVILHELCHTVHHDHSAKFYKLLTQVCPQRVQLEAQIKKYSPDL